MINGHIHSKKLRVLTCKKKAVYTTASIGVVMPGGANFNSVKDGWTNGRTDGRMDGWTEFLPILQDFVPYPGRCPKTSG